MHTKVRSSWIARLLALSFIYLIVLSNIWFAIAFTSSLTPAWLQNMFFAGVLAVLVFGFSLIVYFAYLWRTGRLYDEGQEDET